MTKWFRTFLRHLSLQPFFLHTRIAAIRVFFCLLRFSIRIYICLCVFVFLLTYTFLSIFVSVFTFLFCSLKNYRYRSM